MSGDIRALFFGDEIVAGQGDASGRGWVGRVVADCHEHGLPVLGYNLGVAGESTVHTSLRIQEETVVRLQPGVAARLILAVSRNDAGVPQGPAIADGEVLEAIHRAIGHAAIMETPVFVVGPPPSGDPVRSRRLKTLADQVRRVCATRRTPYADLWDNSADPIPWSDAVVESGLRHPTGVGYDVLARRVVAAGLVEWLSGSVPTRPVLDR